MTIDLDTRLAAGLADAATTTFVSDDAFAAIHRRAEAAERGRRPRRWALAGGLTAAVVITGVIALATADLGSSPPTMAAIQLPGLDQTTGSCGVVTSRPAGATETARVAHLPAVLPDGYGPASEATATVQERAASSIACWSADVTYVDVATGRLLTAMLNRQGSDAQPGCRLPEGYRPAECTTVGGRPAGLTNEGTRATVSWITPDDDVASVSGYGLTTEELIGAAETLTFDGTNVAVRPPSGMNQIENTPKTRTDARDVTYYGAVLASGDPARDVEISVSTWDDISVNEVGPAGIVELDGATALVVTTGGPGTGITGWTVAADAVDPLLDVVAFDQPARAYVTWNEGGLTFRITGPDAETVTFVARQLGAT